MVSAVVNDKVVDPEHELKQKIELELLQMYYHTAKRGMAWYTKLQKQNVKLKEFRKEWIWILLMRF